MTSCRRCGRQLPREARYCDHCGQYQTVTTRRTFQFASGAMTAAGTLLIILIVASPRLPVTPQYTTTQYATSATWHATTATTTEGYGIIMGRITDTTGAALGGAAVAVAGRTVTANEQGWFVVDKVPASDRVLATFSKTGYVATHRITAVRAGESTFLKATMAQASPAQPLNAVTGGTVTQGGASITFEPNSLMDFEGKPFTGTAQVSLTPFDPSVESDREVFPGNFAGLVGGVERPFESFGFIHISVTEANGNRLELASGKTATIEIPIPSDALDRAPRTIDVWYFDTSSHAHVKTVPEGFWSRYTEGNKTVGPRVTSSMFMVAATPLQWRYYYRWPISKLFGGGVYWNADSAYGQSHISAVVGVRGSPFTPLANVRVVCDGVDYNGRTESTTGTDGRVWIPVRNDSNVRIWAESGGMTSDVLTVTTSPENETKDVGEIILYPPLAQVILTWGENPSDLDLHVASIIAGEKIHISYGNKGSPEMPPHIFLDTDDTNGYGPEIITFTRGAGAGTYRYSVHHFAGNGTIETSGAVVTVVIPGAGIRTFTPPTGQPTDKTIWRIADIVVGPDGKVTAVNPINDYVTYDESSFYP